MPISDGDREAYEKGQTDRNKGYIEVVIESCAEIISAGTGNERSESEQAAYDKGRSGEQLDGDKDSGNSEGCYLTTACVLGLGLSDNCEELTILRWFRDSYLLSSQEGRKEVELYYATAPKAVARISGMVNAQTIHKVVYSTVVSPSVKLIQRGQFQLAHLTYKKATQRLFKALGI